MTPVPNAPAIVRCPKCRMRLKADHFLGRKVKCPGCGQVFVTPTAPMKPERSTQEMNHEEAPSRGTGDGSTEAVRESLAAFSAARTPANTDTRSGGQQVEEDLQGIITRQLNAQVLYVLVGCLLWVVLMCALSGILGLNSRTESQKGILVGLSFACLGLYFLALKMRIYPGLRRRTVSEFNRRFRYGTSGRSIALRALDKMKPDEDGPGVAALHKALGEELDRAQAVRISGEGTEGKAIKVRERPGKTREAIEAAMKLAREALLMEGIGSDSSKQSELAGLFANIEAALSAFDSGVDAAGRSISPSEIGDGLRRMLGYMREHGIWFRLDVNATEPQRQILLDLAERLEVASACLLGCQPRVDHIEREPASGAQPSDPPLWFRCVTCHARIPYSYERFSPVSNLFKCDCGKVQKAHFEGEDLARVLNRAVRLVQEIEDLPCIAEDKERHQLVSEVATLVRILASAIPAPHGRFSSAGLYHSYAEGLRSIVEGHEWNRLTRAGRTEKDTERIGALETALQATLSVYDA